MPILENETDRPREIPLAVWDRAVNLVRELAADPTVTFFWPVWVRVFKSVLRHVDGGASSALLYRLYDEYQRCGGQGSVYEPWPVPASGVAQDAAVAAETTSEPSTAGTPGVGQDTEPSSGHTHPVIGSFRAVRPAIDYPQSGQS